MESGLIQRQEIFKEIEKTGEQFKQEFINLSRIAQKRIESQIQSTKLEAAYALTINKKQRAKTMSDVKNIRNELWKQSLDKANGDSKKATIFYDEICAFP